MLHKHNHYRIPKGWRQVRVGEMLMNNYKYLNSNINKWEDHNRMSVGQRQLPFMTKRIVKKSNA